MSTLIAPIILVSIRLLPIFIVAPIPPLTRAPILVRTILVVSLAIIIASGISPETVEHLESVTLLMCVTEFLIGASLAFSFHAAVAAVHTFGQLIDMQIGFAAASLFDPSTDHMATPSAEILTIGLMLVLLSTNVHHDILIGFTKLLSVIPPGGEFRWNPNWLKTIGGIYVLGFIILSPIIITLWLTDIVLAFISRSLPQTPIYFVGLPVKIFIGLLTLAWFFTQGADPLFRLLEKSLGSWETMFRV